MSVRRGFAGQAVAAVISFLLTATPGLWAQAGRGGVSGTVADSSRAVIPGAAVELTNVETGVTLSTVTTGSGLYSFVSLVPARYRVTVKHPSFTTVVQNNVTVTVDQVTTVNITLNPGAVSQVITVTEAPPLIEATNATIGQLITAPTISRVPLVTRDVYELVQLSAGVYAANGVPNAADTQAVFNSRPGADVSGYTMNGAQQGATYYLLDGSPIAIPENNLASLIPAFQVPLDAVQEYRVETQSVPANYQSAGAGVISLVTKSGTNQFHGSAFAFIRPNAFSANDLFVKTKQISSAQPNQPPDFHRYQEGGSFGGPIVHNKLFFFGDYEATQQGLLQTGTYTVPTAAERSGDFSADGFTIYSPLAPDLANGKRQPFSGNTIPTSALNPIALKYAQQFPLPNQAGVGIYHANNYFASALDPNDAQKFDVRLDYYQGDRQRIFGRFSFDRLKFGNADLYGANNIYDPYYYQNITNGRNALLADDVTLTPSTVLELRYSFTRHFENQTGDPRQVNFDMTSLGFPASLAAQQVYRDIPFVSFGNGSSNLGSNPYTTFHFASMSQDVIAAINTTKAKHDLSFGFEFQKLFMNEGQPIAPSGSYAFDNTATSSTTFAGNGSDFASFLLGMGEAPGYESSNFTKDIFGAQASPYYAVYIQDNYHLTQKLVINLGLRWDVFGGRTERYNRLEYFDPAVHFTVNGVPLMGGEQFVGHGNRSPFATNWNNVGPRIGLAYQPVERMVIRGGFGIYYGPSTQMVANSALDSDGFFASTNWVPTAYNANSNTVMVNSLSNPFPNGVVQPTNSSSGPATNLGSTLATALHSQPTPTTYDFNFGVEYQFPQEYTFSAAWVGSRGLHLPLAGVSLNQLPLGVIGQYQAGLSTAIPNAWGPAFPATYAFYNKSTVPQFLALEPFPQFNCGSINCGVTIYGYPGGDSIYHSLQLKLQKRLTSHFTMLAAYTWGKLITDELKPPLSFIGSHSSTYQDWRNLNLERGLSPQDLSYSFTWQASYDLPVGRNRAIDLGRTVDKVLGGWTANAILYFSSGVPINDPTGTGDPYFSQRVNLTCDPSQGAAHTVAQWFNYACLSQPASRFFAGTAPAYLTHVRTDGGHNLDASIYKNVPLTEKMSLQLEFAAYNVTNTPQVGYPRVFWNPTPTAANMAGFGQITSTVNVPRQLQFAAKFSF